MFVESLWWQDKVAVSIYPRSNVDVSFMVTSYVPLPQLLKSCGIHIRIWETLYFNHMSYEKNGKEFQYTSMLHYFR